MVNHRDFKKSSQSAFCMRQKAFAQLKSIDALDGEDYSVIKTSIILQNEKGLIAATIESKHTTYLATFTCLQDNIVRFQFCEQTPLFDRYTGPREFCLVESDPQRVPFNVLQFDNDELIVCFGSNRLIINLAPFNFVLYVNNVPAISCNKRGYFNYESYQKRADKRLFNIKKVTQATESLMKQLDTFRWEESFEKPVDAKPDVIAAVAAGWEQKENISYVDTKPKGCVFLFRSCFNRIGCLLSWILARLWYPRARF